MTFCLMLIFVFKGSYLLTYSAVLSDCRREVEWVAGASGFRSCCVGVPPLYTRAVLFHWGLATQHGALCCGQCTCFLLINPMKGGQRGLGSQWITWGINFLLSLTFGFKIPASVHTSLLHRCYSAMISYGLISTLIRSYLCSIFYVTSIFLIHWW